MPILDALGKLLRPPVLVPARVPFIDPVKKVYQQTGLWVPQPLRMVQRRCCCGECDCRCSNCRANDVPCCFRVVFTGLANKDPVECGSCADYNSRAFRLQQSAADNCIWSSNQNPASLCDPTQISLEIFKDGNDYKLKVSLGNHLWIKNYGTSLPSCVTLDSESIPHDTNSGDCDSSSATCTVTRFCDSYRPCPCPCLGVFPDEWSVTMAGFANGDCSDCGVFNDTFILGNRFDNLLFNNDYASCHWYYQLPSTTCFANYIILWVNENATGDPYRVAVSAVTALRSGGPVLQFHNDYASMPTCSNFSNEALTTQRSFAECDESSATCEVTAL